MVLAMRTELKSVLGELRNEERKMSRTLWRAGVE